MELPSPTVWPIVLALGIALILAGMVTHWAISLLGLILMLRASVGWFREVLPHEHRESLLVTTQVVEIATTRGQIDRLSASESHRKMLPVETYTVTAGIKGGVAGGVAMIAPAILYGMIHYHSAWYAANLLAAAVFVSWANASTAFLCAFHMDGLIVAAIHSRLDVTPGRHALWGDASYVSEKAYLNGGICGTAVMVRIALHHSGSREPTAGSANRLVVVHRFAIRIWARSGICRQSSRPSSHRAISVVAVCCTRRS